MNQTHLSKLLYILFLLALSACQPKPNPQPAEQEPIAYIGHGAFFGHDGKQIVLTLEFVAKVQDWYRNKLLSTLTESQRVEFAEFEKSLNANVSAEGQARLVVQQYLLNWLVAKSKDIGGDGRTVGKLNAIKYALHWKIPSQNEVEQFQYGEEYKIDPELEKMLKPPESKSEGFRLVSATIDTGQAYINDCIAAGVPIPPPIGQLDPAGLTGWKSQGFIPDSQQFIVGTPAEVRTFQSSSPEGMCFALPRYTDNTLSTVQLDGVICLGQASSKACIWDNQMNGVGFPFASGTQIPIGVPDLSVNPAGQYQGGGFELNNGSGGVCTDCHGGQNPYIIHPNANLNPGGSPPVLMGNLNPPPHSLTFSASRYDPLVPASWPQNQLSHSTTLVPAVCSGCHQAGLTGGGFPHLSTELAGYCNTILAQAITKTMPPSNPGSQASNPDVVTFRNWCGIPASSGPSNRGDPHLTTTNGINYDFQAAGEFTALRNSATNFELQTRQMPVPTAAIPPANPYTGLASCVSLNTAVAVRVDNHRITYQPSISQESKDQGLELRVDGKLVDLPDEGIKLGNGNLIRRADSNGALNIILWDGTHVLVTPNYWASQDYWYLNIDVLNTPAREGTMGHIPAGDWLPLAPDGSSFGPAPAALDDRHVLLNEKFADAWRVTSTSSLFDYAVGTSTDNFIDRQWPPKPGEACTGGVTTRAPVKPMEPQLATQLCSAIKDETAFANCVFDLTATGDEGMVDAYLRSLQLREKVSLGGP